MDRGNGGTYLGGAYLGRRGPRPPAGLEGHLTRRQAARLIGLASEYKIREAEREGRLTPVRGAMGTAFYPRAEVEALGRVLAFEAAAAPFVAPSARVAPARPVLSSVKPSRVQSGERRSELRLERAALIRRMRDPDPGVREAAFLALRGRQSRWEP